MNIENLSIANSLSAKKKKSNPSFSGNILTKDNRGNDVYKFNLPNAPKGTSLEVNVLTKDKNGNYKVTGAPAQYSVPEGFSSVYIKAKDFDLDRDSVLAYKFMLNGNSYMDNAVQRFGYNVSIPTKNANNQKSRVMEHILVDSFNVPKSSLTQKRNHFNILGGTLNSLKDKIPYLKKSGVTHVLGTPIFGQDNKSSHGYWTNNPYQITNNLGNKTEFNNLMLELFKNDMGWTADGAFVNEGLQGIHLKDMMVWGDKSPFVYQYETKDIGNQGLAFGVLSKSPDVDKHTHIKLVNAPYKIIFEKGSDGIYKESKVISNPSFDSTKPTFIQTFSDKLASEEQMNSDELFDVYAKKNPDDNHEISNYRDAVQTYQFRVSPKAVRENFEKYKNLKTSKNGIEFKSFLTEWPNFKLVPSNKDGGVALWVGNSDIAKKRFVLPESAVSSERLSDEQKDEILAAQYQVQDDTVQIGKFWTEEVSRLYTEYTAKQLADKIKGGKTYQQAIEELVIENKLPQSSLSVLDKDEKGVSALDNILKTGFDGNRRYKLLPTVMPVSITDAMMSVPFESIEFAPDLSTVFAYPFIKNVAVSKDTVGMSRYEMYKMGDEYYNQIPERYREIYKKADLLLASDMKNQAKNILSELSNKMDIKTFEDDGSTLTQEGRELLSLVYPDIVKFLVVSALSPKTKQTDNAEMLEYNLGDLQKVGLESLNLQYETTPESVAESLLNKLQKGLDRISYADKEKFVNHLYGRLKNVDSDSINVAKLILEKSESGLDWRIDASKDVGDWDAVESGKFSYDENQEAILNFWKSFNKGVRDFNPKSYTIGELTDWQLDKFDFLDNAGFTTVSDYEAFYSSLPSFYGNNSEGVFSDGIANVIKDKFGSYANSGTLDSLNYAHRFVGNQDKPRILSVLAMDIAKFNKNKSGAMGDALKRGFYGSPEFLNLDEGKKQVVMSAIDKLSNGKYTHRGDEKIADSSQFGTRPFDYNIEDVINEAAFMNDDFNNFVNANKETVRKMKASTLKSILEPAMDKYRALMLLMAALPGTPTNYAGDELGATGWETFAKNEHQENRNALRWDWLKDDSYKFINDFNSRISAVLNIRKKPQASALVNGSTIMLENQNGSDRIGALYRYNDKTDAIAVYHNIGYSNSVHDKGKDVSIDNISLKGLPNGLPEGTIYIDALNPSNRFKVKSKWEIVPENGGKVNLGTAGIILLREKDFNGNYIEDPKVKLQNTKYNLKK